MAVMAAAIVMTTAAAMATTDDANDDPGASACGRPLPLGRLLRSMAQSGPDSETDHDTGDAGDGPGDDDPDGFTPDADATDTAESTTDEDEDEGEWQFGLDEVGPDGIVESEPEPLEPGTPTIENVFFVLVGVVGTLLLLWTVV